MGNTQCFKIKEGTAYEKAVKEHYRSLKKWDDVFKGVGELLGEKIERMGFYPDRLVVDLQFITKEENRKMFKKDGTLKANLKKANELNKQYQKIVADAGLSDFKDLRELNFAYGMMRFAGQSMVSFLDSNYDIYYKTDFDYEKQTKGNVVPITEIEYEEAYLKELKFREAGEGRFGE